MIYQPKGSMCSFCFWKYKNCSQLPFDTMPVFKRENEQVIAICTQYTPEEEDKK